VFMRKDKAHEVLSVHKRANYFLEEIRPGNLERECIEEKCSFEEAKEIFHSREKTPNTSFSKGFTINGIILSFLLGLNPCNTNPCRNGGVCKIRHYSYFCICPPSFSGENCERGDGVSVSIAEKQQCWYKNGGCWHYCQDTDSAFQVGCSCAQGYAPHEDGKRCVQSGEAPCCLAPHPRLNGSGAAHGDVRIAGGMFCQRGQCPWQVLIRNSRGEGFCGGSLISSRWVVTAAHCLDLVRPHHVTVDFDKYQREMKEQKIGVERSWPHPHYDSDNYNSDIALLYLSSEVAFNEFALPICLPSPNLAALLTEEGRVGTVSGWGATHQRGATLRFLMRVRVPVVSMESCQRSMDRLVTDNMFCAGYEVAAEDACKGDSGGPFAVPYHNTWFLLGIVSWGEGCAEKGKYGVYTRVANYIPWIKEVVE
ncbi:FAXD protein, partial [Eudromia elegans]|nr:FAXD protein [Eudromia elegans]